MKQKKRSPASPIAFVLVLALLFSMVTPIASYAGTARDVTGLLTGPKDEPGPTVTVTQGGKQIGEDDTIDSTEDIAVGISFRVPVWGDYTVDPDTSIIAKDDVVQQGDVAYFELSNAFKTPPSGDYELEYGDVKVGTAKFITSGSAVWVKIIFDGDDIVFSGENLSENEDPYHSVKCTLKATFGFKDDLGDGEWGEVAVKILDKDYTVVIPEPETQYTVDKMGEANLATQEIEWSVTVSAIKGGKPVDLIGYEFSDDLTGVGDYVDGSFAVNGVAAEPVWEDSTLKHTFTESTSPQAVVSFKTKISDDKYFTSGQQTVTNTAELLTGGAVVTTGAGVVKFTPKWIEKSGSTNDTPGEAHYDPTGRTITWTIIANHNGASLNGVVITDELRPEEGLTVASAFWQAWEGTTWGAITILPTTETTSKYAIGNVHSKILLTIVANVPDGNPDTNPTTGKTYYHNSASIDWDDLTGSGIGTGTVDVGIGYNAITKSGTADPGEAKIKWTVKVDAKQQPIPDMKVYDLLVYGSSGSGFNINTVDGIPDVISPSALTPRYDQKYVKDSFSGSTGLSVTVHAITQGGVRVADLLEISGLSYTTPNEFTFYGQVLNPDIFAGNKTNTVWNTAALFSSNAKLNAADASVSYPSKMLGKEMLKRNSGDPASAVNSGRTTVASEGFDYTDKSVIFRLSVNADGLDLTDAKNAKDKALGAATVTDTLPEGWEFAEITDGAMYLIFEGTTGSATSVTATGDPLDSASRTAIGLSETFSGGTAVFTFAELNKPYVILVKARPTDKTIKEYFNSNKTTTTKTNNLNLKTENWPSGIDVKQDVSIKSEILGKKAERLANGVVKWTVEYKPAELEMEGRYLEDTLPLGADLRIDSTGALIIGGNITAQALTLNPDGSYALDPNGKVDLVSGPDGNIDYDNAARLLKFKIPEGSKAYRFEYITDITGESGKITNAVSLYGTTSGAIDNSANFTVQDADASATMEKTGWIQIAKTDGDGDPIPGAEFTILASDGKTVIRKGQTGTDGTLKLRGIPEGTYTLLETAAPSGYALEGVSHTLKVENVGGKFSVSIDGKTGTGANTLTMKNFADGTVGNLMIRKTVAGSADEGRSFEFKLKFLNSNGSVNTDTYQFTDKNGVLQGTLKSGDTFSLKHGETITVNGLPKDLKYIVEEVDYSGAGYSTVVTGDTAGTITADKTTEVVFTNTKNKPGSLTISKTVTGNAAEAGKRFEFTVTLSDKVNTYSYAGSSSGSIKGSAVIELGNGESVTIADLLEGTAYTVTERDYSGDGYTTISSGTAGAIDSDTIHTAAFTNTKSKGGGGGGGKPPEPETTTKPGITTPEAIYGSVRIVKVDGADTSKTLAGAVFQLFSENGALLQTSPVTGSDGVAVFDDLETGAKYSLKEVTAPDGYQPSKQTYSFVLSKDGAGKDVSVTFRNTKEGDVVITGIDPNDVPEGWVVIEDKVPAGPGDLDDTPKTGVDETSALLLFSLTALVGMGALIKGLQVRRRRLVAFRKGK